MEYIKSELKKAGYNVKVNQEWDTKTKKYVSGLFKKRGKTGVNVNSISEVYENMWPVEVSEKSLNRKVLLYE